MRPLLIGIGNSLRGDDGLGREFVHRLLIMLANDPTRWSDFDICESDGSALSLMDLWGGRDDVVIVDAVMDPTKTPGSLMVLEAKDLPATGKNGRSSTHSLGLAEAIELAKSLAILPPRLTIVGVVGQAFNVNDEVSEPVARAVENLAQNVALRLPTGGWGDA